jgi:hypothetical protein
MWSDPEDIETWAVSPRGAGWLFGSKVTQEVRVDAMVCASGTACTCSTQGLCVCMLCVVTVQSDQPPRVNLSSTSARAGGVQIYVCGAIACDGGHGLLHSTF